jgi:hypothetical protein
MIKQSTTNKRGSLFTTISIDTLSSLLGSKSEIVVSKRWLSNIELVAGDRREDIEEIQKRLKA